MAKATITKEDGTKITIEGTAEEVAGLVARLSPASDRTSSARRGSKKGGSKAKDAKPRSGSAQGQTAYIRVLIREGFFKTRRGLGEIKTKLEEQGHIYPVTSLSPIVVMLVRKKELRRLKEGGGWKYVNP